MISVFDVATHEELMEMFSFEGEEYDKEELLEMFERNPDSNNGNLALFYADRDIKKAKEYLALIKNKEYRQDIALTMSERTE
jgi:hypothetical protein